MIGLSKVAAIYPHHLQDSGPAAPLAPFGNFNEEGRPGKNYFRTGDKQSMIQV